MSRGPDTEATKRTVLRVCLVLWLLGCIAMGLLAYLRQPDSPWASWQDAAKRAEAAHKAQLLLQTRERNERDYIAYIQHQCGDEAWFRPRDGASPVCTNKHGRGAGQPYTGVQP